MICSRRLGPWRSLRAWWVEQFAGPLDDLYRYLDSNQRDYAEDPHEREDGDEHG